MARVLPESKLRARRRKRAVFLYCFAAALFFPLAGGLVWFSWQPFVRIQAIRVVGAQTIATSTLGEFVHQRLLGEYFGVLPKDNVFLYPKGRIESALRSAYPIFEDAAVHADTFSSLSVVVSERRPRALWCGASFNAAQKCLFMDAGGAAYGAAPEFSGAPYTRYYGALTSDTLPAQFISSDAARPLFALMDAIVNKAGEVRSVDVNENRDVVARFESGFTLTYSLADDTAKIFQHFSLALKSAPFSAHPLSDFEYLDLRFGDKLYYKLK